MIFGFSKKKASEKTDEEKEVDLVLFKGALSGNEPDMSANAQITKVGLTPAKQIITDGLLRRAEMIRIDPKGDRAAVTLFVDGMSYPGTRLSKQHALAVTQVLKLLCGLDVKTRRKLQTGGVRIESKDRPYELLVDVQPVPKGGERLIMRIRNRSDDDRTPEELGMPPDLKTKIREMTAHNAGLVFACGPPFSGTTSTAYMLLRSLDAFIYVIFTVCDTDNRELLNINAFEANPDESLDLMLTRITRLEGNVVFLGSVDQNSLKTAFDFKDQLSMIGEFGAKDAAHGLMQLIEWLGDPKRVSEGVKGLVSQKLIRKLCPDCREAYRPNAKILAKVGLPPETKTLYRKPKHTKSEDDSAEEPEPCATCGDIGYIGRTAMFEVLEMTDALKELVTTSPSPKSIRQLARKEKMMNFQENGIRLVAEGITSLEEVQRVFKPA